MVFCFVLRILELWWLISWTRLHLVALGRVHLSPTISSFLPHQLQRLKSSKRPVNGAVRKAGET